MENFKENRDFMRANFSLDFVSDQQKELPQPPLEKPYEEGAQLIDLPELDKDTVIKPHIHDCIVDRKSRRKYGEEALTLKELSYLLWTTQGVKEIKGNNYATFRPVPSGGARHPFETYLAVSNVEGLEKGIYRYIALEHKLLFLYGEENISEKIVKGTLGQKFAGTAPVTFIWSCVAYRGEWRYNVASHKTMLLDAGHLGHGLYLSCEAIGCGTCAIAAYDQKLMDELVQIDGQEEFVVYMSPVGRA